jgi:NADH-quinone oxidoreductase subunit L
VFTEPLAWLILALPVASFLVNGLLVRRLYGAASPVAGYVTIAAVGGSFVLSLWALGAVVGHYVDGPITSSGEPHVWLEVGGIEISFGILLDPLTAIMLVVVSGVSLLVQFYSQMYMRDHHGHRDASYTRYYAYMSLFTASMLGLVMSRNIIQVFVFWELVGVSSYLLIGFWMDRPSAAAAAKKAFIMTRFADFGFLLAILYLFSQDPSWLDIPELYHAAEAGLLTASAATWIGLGLFMGAAGKSAQFPFHSWLPDAMEGPTPVSALIHSATMVTAGVFLVARFFPVYEVSSSAMNVVALIGGFTAVFAATMGLVSNDIKRVLAYSTVSQLGYMMLALGIGAYVPAIFHLFTHAWFKAMLFLGSGSVHHASGTFNMRYMGGLGRHMPWTYRAMLIGSLSLAGIFPFSGFWSKDEILAHAWDSGTGIGTLVLLLGFAAAAMTAFYMFRAIFMTFHGEFRGGGEKEREDLEHAHQPVPPGLEEPHLKESPWVMVGPVVFLALAAIAIGFIANPVVDTGIVPKHGMAEMLTENEPVFPDDDAAEHAGAEPHFNWPVAIISAALALGGIALAYGMYASRVISPERLAAAVPGLYRLIVRKYLFDELYEGIIVNRLFYRRLAFDLDRFDKSWLDNVSALASGWTARLGRGLTVIQNGQTQTYALVMAAGLVVAVTAYFIWGT